MNLKIMKPLKCGTIMINSSSEYVDLKPYFHSKPVIL